MTSQTSKSSQADSVSSGAGSKPRLDDVVDAVQSKLESVLDRRALPINLREAARYALLGGGKRLRPVLIVRCCQAVGGTLEQAITPAAAIELIHTFSLVHDDLPAMDDDDMRRGRATLHKHTNEAMAILAGDLMNTLAFELLTTQVEPAELAAAMVRELATATDDMIAGQVYDTLPEFGDDVPPLDRLKTIHRHKTGALITAACRLGALAGQADDLQMQALTAYGRAIGLMFQVVDDILDVTQSSAQLGKTAGKDQAQDKLTYPALLGLDASREHVQQLLADARSALEPVGDRANPLADLAAYMAVRSN